MSRRIEIMNMKEGWATISIHGSAQSMEVPLSLLPKDSRQGDILQLQINFSPFRTLEALKDKDA